LCKKSFEFIFTRIWCDSAYKNLARIVNPEARVEALKRVVVGAAGEDLVARVEALKRVVVGAAGEIRFRCKDFNVLVIRILHWL
jgi:hypothetical protein